MEIKEINPSTDGKSEWENFLLSCNDKTFLQSWNWGDFNEKTGSKIWRMGIYSYEKLIAVCLAVEISAKRGRFLFIPHGPVVAENVDKKEVLACVMERLKVVAKKEKANFIRISPLFPASSTGGLQAPENENIFSDLGFRNAPMHSSAYEATWRLDINLPEAELLKNMRKTTRYLIKKASENSDILIEKTSDPKNIEIYQKLNKEVSARQKFVPFSNKFIKNEFEIFNADNEVLFFFGKYKGEVAAGAMIIFWSGIAFYHQAASISKFAKYSIPYLLQWEAIKEAKARGCKIYDFWGFTDPEKYPKHPWAGPTLFKMGFGGYKTEYVKTQDFVISKKYWINYIIEKIRKFKRGL